MSSLSQGQSASLILKPGDVYRISSPGVVTVKPAYGAPAVTTTITANTQDFGPYDANVKLDVAASSDAASYALLQPNPVVYDSTTGKATAGGAEVSLGGAVSASSVVPAGATTSGFSGKALTFPGRAAYGGAGGYPGKRVLSVPVNDGTAVVRTVSGSVTLSHSRADPFLGNTYTAVDALNGNNPSNGFSLNIAFAGSTQHLIGENALKAAMDLTGTNIYVTFRHVTGQAPNIRVRMYDYAAVDLTSANYKTASVTYPNGQLSGQWQTLSIPVEDFYNVGTGAAITAITHVVVETYNSGSVTGEYMIGQVFACPKVLTKAAIIFAFDDCRADTWTEAAKYMIKKGIPGVLYPGALASVLRGDLDQYQMSAAQARKLQDLHGWQIASQAWDTEAPSYTADTFLQNMNALKQLQAAQRFEGGADGSFFSDIGPPGGIYTSGFEQAFRTMRGYKINSAAEMPSVALETAPLGDPKLVRAIGVDTSIHTGAILTAICDRAVARNAVAIFVFHGVSTSTAPFTTLVDYVAANPATMRAITMDQLINKIKASAI